MKQQCTLWFILNPPASSTTYRHFASSSKSNTTLFFGRSSITLAGFPNRTLSSKTETVFLYSFFCATLVGVILMITLHFVDNSTSPLLSHYDRGPSGQAH